MSELKQHGGKIALANKILIPGIAARKFPAVGAMVDSWSKPFYDTFSESKSVRLYEVSFIDSWLLCLNPIK
ncbi:restriction of telomere capping 1 [Gossypium australe]|uniref:Restriction of telomere capping 1 n=1 Tax=Gossypium australe TaxID=47621 RepID=A0A5B6VM01_9ROSI|nr:restriction of telomere capping 1 [Gossypium australe]